LQVLRLQLEAGGQPLAADAPGNRLQFQRLQLRTEGRADVRERDVGGAAHDLPLVQVRPCAQAATTLRDVYTQVGLLPQPGQIDPGEIGMHLAAPLLPAPGVRGQQRLAELAHQREALAPVARRRRVEAQHVAVAPVARDEVHLAEHQRRSTAFFVGPLDPAALQDHLGLVEEPVGGAPLVVAAAREVQAAHEDPSAAVTPDVHARLVDVKLFEAQVPQRPRRQRGDHRGQGERGAPLRVQQLDVLEGERRDQALAARADAADAHGHPQHLAGAQFQRGAKLADSRHNELMERTPGQGHEQSRGQQQPQGPLDRCGKQPQRA
jgi:hypothetical protein